MKEVIMQAQSSSIDYPKAPIYVGDLVRCKDCKWWQDNIGYYSVSYCPWDDDIGTPNADDFCSWGERIEE